MKVVSVHQPHYYGWLGLLHKIAQSDVHILYDTVQYEKQGYQNRVQIKTDKGAEWLTVPVNAHLEPINEITIANQRWQETHWKTLEQHYSQTPYWEQYKNVFRHVFDREYDKLVDVTYLTTLLLVELLSLETELLWASHMEVRGGQTERLVQLCLRQNADVYLAGMGASQAYLDADAFAAIGIDVQYQQFSHPVYSQRYGEFMAGLSAIDAICNVGVEQVRRWVLND